MIHPHNYKEGGKVILDAGGHEYGKEEYKHREVRLLANRVNSGTAQGCSPVPQALQLLSQTLLSHTQHSIQ